MPSTSERKCSSFLRRRSRWRSASSLPPSARTLAARNASVSRQTSVPSRKNTRSGTVSRLNPDKELVGGRKKVVCGQTRCERREQSWSKAAVPGADHYGAEDQQERSLLHDQRVEKQLDQERHPDGQHGNAVPQEQRRVLYGKHLDRVPVENRGTVNPQRAYSGSHSHLSLHLRYHFAPSCGLMHTANAVFCNIYY